MSSTEQIVRYASAFAGALVLTLAATPLLRRVALRYDFLDQPAERKTHTTPTPYLGGIGLIAAVLLGLAFAPGVPNRALTIVVGALGVGIIGLLDDRITLDPGPRLAVQINAALVAVAAGIRIEVGANDAINIVVTVLWIVGITNAFNLLDNMDGLGAGAASLAGIGTFLFAVHFDKYLVAAAAASVVGGCLGFLAYNKRPASIFMGDAGALALGYSLAVLTIDIRPDFPTPRSWIVPALLLWLPILDTSFVVVSRLRGRRPLLEGAKDHLSHRLVARGFSEGRAVLVLLGFYAVVLAAAIARLYDVVPGGLDRTVALAVTVLVVKVATGRPATAVGPAAAPAQ